MNRVSGIRRVTLGVLLGPVLATSALAQVDESVQSLDAIREAAQTFVVQQVPKQAPGTLQVNVGALDSRLRLAPCECRCH